MPVGFQGLRRNKTALVRRNREIVRLRDTYGLTFVVIGKRFGISATIACTVYHKQKGASDDNHGRVPAVKEA